MDWQFDKSFFDWETAAKYAVTHNGYVQKVGEHYNVYVPISQPSAITMQE